MNFNGKTALVTGAAMGIGKATALTFAQNGAKVIIVDMDEERLQGVKNEIEQMGAEALAYVCDVSDEQKVNEITKDALDKFGKIDILVNNAGIFNLSERKNLIDLDINIADNSVFSSIDEDYLVYSSIC